MDKKRICIVCVIMVFSIMTGYLFEKESKEEISMEPDVVSSISMNRDQYLTVVANRNRIEDKEEFAKLLVKMCRENSFHVLVFEELSGKTYIECKKELETYLHRENPFVVTNTSYRGSNLQLASVEDAWEELDIYITDELWSKFILLFYEVLIESEPIFDYPFEKHFEASIYAEKPEWSPTLKKGMIRTLIMRAYYRGHEENQKQIDNIVSRVLINSVLMLYLKLRMKHGI